MTKLRTEGRDLSQFPVDGLRGVGPRLAEKLAKLGIRSAADLLLWLPTRFQDRTRIVDLGDLSAGDEACFCAEVVTCAVRFGRRRSLMCTVNDGTGELHLRLFHFNEGQRRALAPGVQVLGYGEARLGREGLEMVHPEYRTIAPNIDPPLENSLTPVYPVTEGLGQATMRKLLSAALAALDAGGTLSDTLPPAVRDHFGLVGLQEAVTCAHRPPVPMGGDWVDAVRRRLVLDELLAHHLSLRVLRTALDRRRAVALKAKPGPQGLCARFQANLPFTLTDAQARAAAQIRADLERPRPMHRLLQGDVGSGKTVVAALAAIQAIDAGYQAALMAPTELLAEQHLASLREWFTPLGIDVGWLASKQSAPARRDTLNALANGELSMVVGTHALIQDQVTFARIGVAVIDEQHRFGVDQRLRLGGQLDAQAEHPHVLVMTATPIPRTLAMVAYADLDTSVIDELPPGRLAVETAAIPQTRRDQVIERTARACGQGQQAYWVCPLVEESEMLDCQSAIEAAAELTERLPQLRVGLVHGRMTPTEKEAAMRAFRAAEVDLLVATTVIEVGVDVPNASLMVIENAERMGLAQLHQLRGRVGRGNRKSACVLLYAGRLSTRARARLDVLRESNDGFLIAQRDLDLRGPGEILGVRQAGSFQTRYADLSRDAGLLPQVHSMASMLLRDHAEAVEPLVARWITDQAAYAAA